jgi:hypothetical protein
MLHQISRKAKIALLSLFLGALSFASPFLVSANAQEGGGGACQTTINCALRDGGCTVTGPGAYCQCHCTWYGFASCNCGSGSPPAEE